MMEPKPTDLYEFLVESELQHYYNSIKNELKITMVSHLKYASDEDLKQVGLSKPEIRRLRKFYEKFYPHGYLSKIKRLLQTPVVKKEDGTTSNPTASLEAIKVSPSSKIPSNKHIIPADSICVNKQLGTGEFGIVQQGVWTNGTERIQVAIKCLCRERMQSNPMEFLKEAAIMHSIEHENIVRLYGVVLDTDSLMLVTELAHLRSLLECLKDPGLRVSFLTVPTLCEFAQQICNGMMYLENKRLIHRDLAARNILVFSKNKVKISDFGLSRALGVGKDYYQTNFNVNLKLPIAWCAPECINFLRFTNASDVWAYGVCLWEMFSYGFQPWAALTGHQILEAIDEPNYQRLEAPECCPKEYYTLMLKCWQHDPSKRPKFSEIYEMLPDMKPEQLKTILGCNESKKDHLLYRQNEIISVLDKSTNSIYWKGVLNSGKTGIFNPANTVTYLGSLPSSTNRDSFTRTADRSSKRKLRTEMISKPQNDLKHTGHVGLDGAYFGDVAFLSNAQNYNHVPRQIVTPYKPSEDIEQTPLLLPPTPTSPDSLQTASGYFPESINLTSNHSFVNQNDTIGSNSGINQTDGFASAFPFSTNQSTNSGFCSSNPFINHDNAHNLSRHQSLSQTMGGGGAFTNTANMQDDETFQKGSQRHKSIKWPDIQQPSDDSPHEYHEISDDEITAEKVFDLGPSLLDEMDFMFRSMSTASDQEPKSPEADTTNKKNEITEMTSKLQRKNSSNHGVSSTLGAMTGKSKKKAGTVKPISVKDEKILNQAIDFANELTARSMTDLVSETPTTQSPKRKFSFRFPNLTHHGSMDKDNHHHLTSTNGNISGTNTLSHTHGIGTGGRNRNFSDEIKNVPDLQNSITEESREAYNNLVEKPSQTMGRYDFDKTKLEHFGHLNDIKNAASATLPRNPIHHQSLAAQPPDNFSSKTLSTKKPKEIVVLSMPQQQFASRPMTLPYRSSTGSAAITKSPEVDSNPLRILRDKNYPIVRNRMRLSTSASAAVAAAASTVEDEIANSSAAACESPSYLTNTEYTFSEKDINLHRGSIQKQIATKEIENLNPIPLPPRDRNKVMQTNVKRHIRKHPLIIPASGLQRTLNKVTSPVELKNPTFPSSSTVQTLTNSKSVNQNVPANLEKQIFSPKLKNIDHSYINQDDVNDSKVQKETYAKHFIENNFPGGSDRTYENLETLRNQMHDCTDSASLHFESILEDDCNKIGEMSSPDVMNGFMFEIHKDHYEKPIVSQLDDESDETRNLDIEQRKLEFCQKYPKYVQPKNELKDNILFNKVKETVDKTLDETDACTESTTAQATASANTSAATAAAADEEEMLERKLKDTNSVSCEDLLEFSDSKPKGRERGVESDEVRIMMKVLGAVASPEQCIESLNFIDWDVHKAIKIIMLKKTLNACNLTFEECVESLQRYEWDLQTTILKLKTL